MITVDNILDELAKALEVFGTYSYDDKGPEEVMYLDEIINQLKKLYAEDAGMILRELCQDKTYYQTNVTNKRCKRLADYLLVCMQDMPDDWFEEVLTTSGLEF